MYLYCEGCVIICSYLWVTQYLSEHGAYSQEKRRELIESGEKESWRQDWNQQIGHQIGNTTQ